MNRSINYRYTEEILLDFYIDGESINTDNGSVFNLNDG